MAQFHALEIIEIVDRVLDFLHDDTTSLKHASLVAKRWRAGSQHHLLHTIEVIGDKELSKFLARIGHEPHPSPGLSRSVKNLEITGPGGLHKARISLHFLCWFPQISQLILDDLEISQADWDLEHSPRILGPYSNLIIVRCDFDSSRSIHAILATCPTILRLKILNCRVRTVNQGAFDHPLNVVLVDTLDIADLRDTTALEPIFDALSNTSPRILVVRCIFQEDTYKLQRILEQIGPRVEEFSVYFGTGVDVAVNSLINLTTVRTISIIARKGDLDLREKWPLITNDPPHLVPSPHLTRIRCDTRPDKLMRIYPFASTVPGFVDQSNDPEIHTHYHNDQKRDSIQIDILYDHRLKGPSRLLRPVGENA